MSQVTQVYGGDEINAVVLDPGSAWTRAGWSAEDGPSLTVATAYADQNGEARFGDDQTYLVRGNTEIRNPMKEGVVNDWDEAEGLWRYVLSQASPERNTDYLSESPMLFVEQIWNTKEAQKKTMEFALEDLNSPAMYIGKAPVLSLFSAGRGTGLVVDVGAQVASAAAVIDGFVLYKSAQRSLKAGNYLSELCRDFLGPDIVAPYEIASKTRVNPLDPAEFTRKTNLPEGITKSFRDFQIGRVVDQFKESIVVVPDSANPQTAPRPRFFEFPDGHSIQVVNERFDLGEGLFGKNNTTAISDEEWNNNNSKAKSDSKESKDEDEDSIPVLNPWSEKGITDLVADCLKACDVDARANLANNIVVSGGTTVTQGFTERLNLDLQKIFPMLKIRIFASGNMVERKNSAWIGGSILSSLGTFHQLWVTRQEYEEIGSDQLAFKRFK